MRDFLAFRRMLSPIIVQIAFWVGAITAVSLGIYDIITDQVINGIILIILGPIVVRLACEWVILIFRINETLTEIKNGLTEK